MRPLSLSCFAAQARSSMVGAIPCGRLFAPTSGLSVGLPAPDPPG